MKFPTWKTNPEMLDTGIRRVSFIDTIIPRPEGIAAEIVVSKVLRWDHRTYSWGTDGNGDHMETISKTTYPTIEAARAAWDALKLDGEILYKGNRYAHYVDPAAEAAYIDRLNVLGGDGPEIAAKLKVPYADAAFIRSQLPCER